MKKAKTLITAIGMTLLCLSISAQDNPYRKYTQNLPFSMQEVKAPVFPNRSVNLQDFGAKGDGSSLCTEAFAKAIDALNTKGGGKLIVPQGVWFTGPITLKSNINLHLEKGAGIELRVRQAHHTAETGCKHGINCSAVLDQMLLLDGKAVVYEPKAQYFCTGHGLQHKQIPGIQAPLCTIQNAADRVTAHTGNDDGIHLHGVTV